MCDEVFWESRIDKVYLYPQELQLLLIPLHEVVETLGSKHLFDYHSGLVKLLVFKSRHTIGLRKAENVMVHISKTLQALLQVPRSIPYGPRRDPGLEEYGIKDISNVTSVHKATLVSC